MLRTFLVLESFSGCLVFFRQGKNATRKQDKEEAGRGSDDGMNTPLARYANLHQPADFADSYRLILVSRLEMKADNCYVFPTDAESSNKYATLADAGEHFVQAANLLRDKLHMPKREPIFFLRSSIPLRQLYTITKKFVEDPVAFLSTPLNPEKDPIPSTAQQLFENTLIDMATKVHPFATVLFSTVEKNWFPLFFDLALVAAPPAPSPSFTSESLLKELLPRPSLVCRTFPERVLPEPKEGVRIPIPRSRTTSCHPAAPSRPDCCPCWPLPPRQEAAVHFCANWMCKRNEISVERPFQRCSSVSPLPSRPARPAAAPGCRTLYYCSVECQRADWGRHKRYCEFAQHLAAASAAPAPPAGPAPAPSTAAALSALDAAAAPQAEQPSLRISPDDLMDCSVQGLKPKPQ
ncbi:hypothetical protein PAPYR_4119 [Paratrimastix pyriformis]|uniref:MYND-type domain-containing protein n=1 Tax=Paratrimastix pyriformis TaxID=342808 RepID=A0ABQ8UKJ1_9EUKA|nr:hypothetical protein PAPYR_4119 [Paratrimastix pyriformis]